MVSTHSAATNSTKSGPIEVVPLTLHIGAEIRGVDLTKKLPPEQLKAVREAFLRWKVIFFRDQKSRSRAACRHGAAVWRADHRSCGVRPCRGPSRDLLGRQEPDREREIRGDDGHALVRLAHRRHGGGQSAMRLHPARCDDPALWRRYVLDKSRGRLRRFVGTDACFRRWTARHPCLRAARW